MLGAEESLQKEKNKWCFLISYLYTTPYVPVVGPERVTGCELPTYRYIHLWH